MVRRGKARSAIIQYAFLILLGAVLVFPLCIMLLSSFKTTDEVLSSFRLLPQRFVLDGYRDGWDIVGYVNFGQFVINSIVMVLPMIVGTILSSLLVAYGFSRFEFPLKRILFAIMMALLMLPSSVLIVPRYLMFADLGWVDSYLPFWIPSFFATSVFFIYMFIQFFRGLPRDLDEAATIDGCGSFGILTRILVPLCKPAIVSAAIFQFIWGWNDFFQQNVYINSVAKFTTSLGLRMAMDASVQIAWNNVLAMSVISMVPSTVVFLLLQRYFVEGIATAGLKG